MWLIALPDIDIYQYDQAIPACGQCIKSKRNCPSYRNEVDLMFLDETRMVVKKARTRPPRAAEDGFFEEGTFSVSVPPPWAENLEGPPFKLSASPLNNQSLHDLAVNFVTTYYVGDETSPAIGSNGPTSTGEMIIWHCGRKFVIPTGVLRRGKAECSVATETPRSSRVTISQSFVNDTRR
jgi:hypothetical protein